MPAGVPPPARRRGGGAADTNVVVVAASSNNVAELIGLTMNYNGKKEKSKRDT